MPDRLTLTLRAAIASSSHYTVVHDRVIVPVAGTLLGGWGSVASMTSNARRNTMDIYRQPFSASYASNSAVSVLVQPFAFGSDGTSVGGTIRASNQRVAAGDRLEMRTDIGNAGTTIGIMSDLHATILMEPDDE